MRFSAVWLALVFSVGPGLVANAAAQAVGDAPVSECEQARLDWAANYPPTPPESNSDRLAYLDGAVTLIVEYIAITPAGQRLRLHFQRLIILHL